MSPYLGGSALGMADQIAEGYTLITAIQLKRLTDPELDQLQFEVERSLRDLRGSVVPQDDLPALQARNRKIGRMNGAIQQIQATRAKRRRSL
ncbi:MAG: hypothetical protein V1750_05600 [Acidobacteriota bacterium]